MIPHLRRPLGWARALVAGGVVAAAIGVTATAASAHPLGNFTVNRYARLEVSSGVLRVYYVLDEAEIPAFQDRGALDQGKQAFARQRVADMAQNLSLTVDGTPVVLVAATPDLSQPPGQGGLTTLRLTVVLQAVLPPGPLVEHQAVFSDGNEPGRIGWREVVVVGRGDARIMASTAPARDVSDELLHYPGNLIQAPLQLRTARFTFTPGSQPAPALVIGQAAAAVTRAGGSFAKLVTRQHLTVLGVIGMLVFAAGFGAVHALAPGHGKTIMAAYLVGTKGRPRDAALLGLIVSVMHTASVLILGFILFRLSRSVSPDRVYPWLKLAAGVTVAGFGAALLIGRSRSFRRPAPAATDPSGGPVARRLDPVAVGAPSGARRGDDALADPAHADAHDHDHAHDHAHAHDHDHGHDHDGGGGGHSHGPGGHSHALPDGVAPLSRRGLVILATAGGIFPSPSALIVLIAAFTFNRVGLGLGLIAAFSVGLAVTLTGVGLALVYGREMATRRGLVPALRYLPLASAAAILVLGLIFAESGLHGVL